MLCYIATMTIVFENRDLLRLILQCLPCTAGSLDDGVCFNSTGQLIHGLVTFFVTRMRSWKAVRGVNRLFNAIAGQELASLLEHFKAHVCKFDALAKQAIGTPPLDLDDRGVKAAMMWPYVAFNLNLFTPPLDELDDMNWTLSQYLTRRDPTTCNELLDLLERKCVCCGKPCPLIAKSIASSPESAWLYGGTFGAWAMHPYKGTVSALNDRHVPQGTLFPFTDSDHFIEVAFGYHWETASFFMQLHVYSAISTEERRFRNFLRASRNAKWYQPRIKRLFDLRDPKLHCEERSSRRVTFMAQICMLTPHIADSKDWSVQSIFGLSRNETLAMVKRGSAMVREERLLR